MSKTRGIVLEPENPMVEPPVVGDDANWYDKSRYQRNGTLDAAIIWEKIQSGIYVPHFTGSATSNANFGALFNAAAKLWVSLWFKLDSNFAAGAPADQRVWGKWIDWNNVIYLYFEAATGKLKFFLKTATVTRFSIVAANGGGDIASWDGGRWYQIFCSISDVAKVRLILNGGTIVTDADGNAAPNGANFIIGNMTDGGVSGFEGTISQVKVGLFDLTPGQNLNHYEATRSLFGV